MFYKTTISLALTVIHWTSSVYPILCTKTSHSNTVKAQQLISAVFAVLMAIQAAPCTLLWNTLYELWLLQCMYRLLHSRECVYIGYCMSQSVITCLFLLKPYCACAKHAVVQCYCIISKSPQSQSKLESTSRAEASEAQVATQHFCL